MGLMKLLERVFFKEIGEMEEGYAERRYKERIRDTEREKKRKEHREEMLAATAVNKAIYEKTRKIQAESWKMLREIEREYPQYCHTT